MTVMQSIEWENEFLSQIGRAIDRAREGKSDQWISDRATALGNPISRTAVSEYRRGIRKTISVTDWLTLAAALGVPPVSLLFPDLPDGTTHLFPELPEVNSFDALLWVIGERQTLPEGFDVLFNLENGDMMGEVTGLREYRKSIEFNQSVHDRRNEDDPSREKQLLDALRRLKSLFQEMHALEAPFKLFDHFGTEEERKRTMDAFVNALQEKQSELSKLEATITELGGVFQDEEVHQYENVDDEH
ncbi:TPA: hypothetical protein I8V98_002676 [Corynebacterium striatum]|nr:hypothetical protein [Corynebacterium striatum]HAT1392836.1 hypothetical protein [Corynebacterium striatum]